MEEVFLSFEGTERDGKVALGTYISDAGKRFGLRDDFACDPEAHICEVKILSGLDLLSEMTAFEKDYFPERKLNGEYRLGCHTKLEKSGEVIVMSASGKEVAAEGEAARPKKEENHSNADIDADAEYQKHFAELPLEKKVAELVRLEAITFSETIGFIINSPFSAAGKFMDVLAEFGFKKEADQRASMRPEEHKQEKDEQEKEKETADDTISASQEETETKPA
ncbi:MAG: (2Fe-2S)-binding protein [Acidobacteria bacterium]|nr:(2Fe-2S)-binding protein [Acidobacteriota bacterium]